MLKKTTNKEYRREENFYIVSEIRLLFILTF